jgi:hypothetical protein
MSFINQHIRILECLCISKINLLNLILLPCSNLYEAYDKNNKLMTADVRHA